MIDYFKPLRRKFGVLSLIMTCVFMVGWVRSYSVWDSTHLLLGYGYSLDSVEGRTIWGINQHPDSTQGVIGWDIHQLSVRRLSETRKLLEEGAECRWRFFGFGSANFPIGQPKHLRSVLWFTPYWSIVIPLTMLSAYLLFTKPRKKLTTSPDH